MFWVLENAVAWADVKSNSSSAVGFPDFLEENWQTNGCYHSELTVLRCSSGTIAACPVFPKKQAITCLEVPTKTSNFCWIWLILKHPYSRLLFIFGFIRLNPRFITCHDVIDECRNTAIVLLEYFFRPIDRDWIGQWRDWQIVWNPMWTNFFLQSNIYAILNVCLSH